MSGGAWRGAIRWAFVPFVPAAPFLVYAGPGQAPVREDDATAWARRIYEQRASGDHAFVVRGKLRQVLVLEDPPEGPVAEVAALRLVRLDGRSDRERTRIREHRDEGLFHLRPDRHPELRTEMAVSIRSLVRVGVSAFIDAPVSSTLDANEFRVVCERLVRSMQLDLGNLVMEKASAMLRRMG